MTADLTAAGPTRSRRRRRRSRGFAVRLDNFEGPFDLLLSLIAKHKLDITEVALSKVTDEFIALIKLRRRADVGPRADLVVPAGRRHPARPQGRPAAAAGRRRGRGGPRAARGARPAVRPAAAVPRLQAGRLGPRAADGRRGAAASRARSGSRSGSPTLLPEVLIGLGLEEFAGLAAPGAGAQAGAGAVAGAHPRARRSASASRPASWSDRLRGPGHDDLPGALRRLAGHADHGGAVPRAAGAVPRGRGRPSTRSPRSAS